MSNKYCLCMTFNDKFLHGAEITLYSFLKTNKWFNGDVVVICGDKYSTLSEESREAFGNIYYKTKFVDVHFDMFAPIMASISSSALMGLEPLLYKLPLFTFTEYDKILFADSDIIFIDDVKDFFNADGDFIACIDNQRIEDWKDRTNEYLNTGIFVVNKPLISEDAINKIFYYTNVCNWDESAPYKPHKCQYADQDIINMYTYMANSKVKIAPSIYNIDRREIDQFENIDSINVVHYLRPIKPWEHDTVESYSDAIWHDYEEKYKEWLSCYHFEWGNIDRKYPKHYEDKDKYIVFTCAKNENNYIVEWIEHYLNMGFDKIIICDDNDDDSLIPIISEYIDKGLVEVFDCHHFSIFQAGIMSMFCENGNFAWCGFFDVDEFLDLGCYMNIKEYLKNKEEDCIGFNWMIFGPNNLIKHEDIPLKKRFTKPSFPILNIENSFLKCIMRGGHFKYSDISNCGGHMMVTSNKDKEITYNVGGTKLDYIPEWFQSQFPIRFKEGYIRHYYTKSFDEWMTKSKRGWPDVEGHLPYEKYFKTLDNGEYSSKNYRWSLFLDEKTLFKSTESERGALSITPFINIRIGYGAQYAYMSRVYYLMSLYSQKLFILSGKYIDDEMFNMALECALATNNYVVYAKNNDEIEMAVRKHNNGEMGRYFFIEVV